MKTYVVMSKRLEVLSREIQAKQSMGRNEDAAVIQSQIRRLRDAIESTETSADVEVTIALRSVLESAFDITSDGVSLPSRLRKLGFDEEFFERKEIHQLLSLAKYWRICRYLASASRQHKDVFQSIELHVVNHPKVENWEGRKHFVHAEIQLLVYHDMHASVMLKPRIIAASKLACFLCSSFIQAHGQYGSLGCHGEVLPQWTVPDRDDYDTNTRAAFTRALLRVASDVQKALSDARRKNSRVSRQRPLAHSAFNLPLDELPTPTPSVETLLSGVLAHPTAGHTAQPSLLRAEAEDPSDSIDSTQRSCSSIRNPTATDQKSGTLPTATEKGLEDASTSSDTATRSSRSTTIGTIFPPGPNRLPSSSLSRASVLDFGLEIGDTSSGVLGVPRVTPPRQHLALDNGSLLTDLRTELEVECQLSAEDRGYLSTEDVELFIDIESPRRDNDRPRSSSSETDKSCYIIACRRLVVNDRMEAEKIQRINTVELGLEDVVIEKGDDLKHLCFVLILGNGKELLVRLEWP